jgi:hypothetical protein
MSLRGTKAYVQTTTLKVFYIDSPAIEIGTCYSAKDYISQLPLQLGMAMVRASQWAVAEVTQEPSGMGH